MKNRLDFSEPDWKHLRRVKDAALERFCERALRECSEIIADPARTAHERYLAIFEVLEERDDELAAAFNDLRRSSALLKLTSMRGLGLVTDEEMEGFSPDTRERTHVLLHGFPE
jgi:hypothetical protein